MPRTRNPRMGSMAFWPRKRAKNEVARVRAWANTKDTKLLGFSGYKAGMTHLHITDNNPNSLTKGEDIFCPVTVVECPPLKAFSLRFYKNSVAVSQVFADNLDKELERRGHAFCRYADDSNIYVRSKKAGQRVLVSITKFVEKKLKLKVNEGKSAVARPSQRKFLGYSYMRLKERIKIRVPKETIHKIRKKLKMVFYQARGRNLQRFIKEELNPIINGWINYFKLAETREFAEDLDGWIRRRLRMMMWKQWKRAWTRRSRLMGAGVEEERAVMSAFNRRGHWWNSGASHMNEAFPKNFFDNLGLVSMLSKLGYLRNLGFSNRPGT